MKFLLQILFLLFIWFANLSAAPVFEKVVLLSYEVTILKTENVKGGNITKIGDVDFNTLSRGFLIRAITHKVLKE